MLAGAVMEDEDLTRMSPSVTGPRQSHVLVSHMLGAAVRPGEAVHRDRVAYERLLPCKGLFAFCSRRPCAMPQLHTLYLNFDLREASVLLVIYPS